MTRGKRTLKEIENDYKKIRKVVNANCVTSISQIARLAELTDYEVRSTLAKHPIVYKKILKMIEENKAEKSQRKNCIKIQKRIWMVDLC